MPRWFAYHFVTVDGEKRQISKGPFDRKKDAEAWLQAERQLAREGRPTIPQRLTVAELLDEWLGVVEHRLAPSTLGEYRRIVELRLRPHLGATKLSELRPAHISVMFEDLRRPGANRRGKAAKGLSETTLMHTHAVLRTALAWAVKQRMISTNPAEDVDRPRRTQSEILIWSADELARFMTEVERDRLHPLIRLAAYTGMRRSELLGLLWVDVDLHRNTVSVRRTRTRVGYEMIDRATTKSAAGSRLVDLDSETVRILRDWSSVQRSERDQWGSAYEDGGYVFTREDGSPVHADHVAQRFKLLVRNASDVPEIRFHDLRHTHASLLLAAGVPVLDVSRRIGHASAAVTLNVYAHVVPGQGQRAATAFASLVESDRKTNVG